MSKERQIEEKTCKKCLHYEMCLEHFSKAKADGFYEMTDEEEYFAHADECDFFITGYRKQEWIGVEERLPDIDELCLLSMENRITKHRWVVIGYFHTNYDAYVTHWMPLPEAPKMRKEDEGK